MNKLFLGGLKDSDESPQPQDKQVEGETHRQKVDFAEELDFEKLVVTARDIQFNFNKGDLGSDRGILEVKDYDSIDFGPSGLEYKKDDKKNSKARTGTGGGQSGYPSESNEPQTVVFKNSPSPEDEYSHDSSGSVISSNDSSLKAKIQIEKGAYSLKPSKMTMEIEKQMHRRKSKDLTSKL